MQFCSCTLRVAKVPALHFATAPQRIRYFTLHLCWQLTGTYGCIAARREWRYGRRHEYLSTHRKRAATCERAFCRAVPARQLVACGFHVGHPGSASRLRSSRSLVGAASGRIDRGWTGDRAGLRFVPRFLARGAVATITTGQWFVLLAGLAAAHAATSLRSSHNFHHAHVGKVIVVQRDAFPVVTSDIGSFPLMSTESWQTATTSQRLRYRIARHPITILCAYVTIFLLIGCVDPLLKNPRKYWDGGCRSSPRGTIALLWASQVLMSCCLPSSCLSSLLPR